MLIRLLMTLNKNIPKYVSSFNPITHHLSSQPTRILIINEESYRQVVVNFSNSAIQVVALEA
jgi:hypothetical protein